MSCGTGTATWRSSSRGSSAKRCRPREGAVVGLAEHPRAADVERACADGQRRNERATLAPQLRRLGERPALLNREGRVVAPVHVLVLEAAAEEERASERQGCVEAPSRLGGHAPNLSIHGDDSQQEHGAVARTTSENDPPTLRTLQPALPDGAIGSTVRRDVRAPAH